MFSSGSLVKMYWIYLDVMMFVSFNGDKGWYMSSNYALTL